MPSSVSHVLELNVSPDFLNFNILFWLIFWRFMQCTLFIFIPFSHNPSYISHLFPTFNSHPLLSKENITEEELERLLKPEDQDTCTKKVCFNIFQCCLNWHLCCKIRELFWCWVRLHNNDCVTRWPQTSYATSWTQTHTLLLVLGMDHWLNVIWFEMLCLSKPSVWPNWDSLWRILSPTTKETSC